MTAGEEDPRRGFRLGIDVGGTFTDLVALDEEGGELAFLKVHTTVGDPSEGVIDAFHQYRGSESRAIKVRELVHATTVATNTLLEKRGAKTCILTTRGFKDVLELRRHNRPQMYNLFQSISPPLVPSPLRMEITERLDAEGGILLPLHMDELLDAVREIQRQGIESVAVCFLHAYANPVHEREAQGEILKRIPHIFVSSSHEVWPEFREYERMSTSVLNAYIRPSVDRYLRGMAASLQKEGVETFSVMKSNGGLTSLENARRYPVHLIESGPAAGMVCSAWLGKELGLDRVITLDVGGTTAKAGVITAGTPKVTTEFHADAFRDGIPVGGYPIRSPVIDLVEIGSGGGSVAWIDKARILKVGPQSLGAVPGPACYGLGGREPTVTDANLVLGYLNPEYFHGGRTKLLFESAERVIYDRIARFFDWSLEQAAAAVIRIAKANLVEMVRLVSIRKGLDPRDFSLLAYGGAGPLHAGFIAKELNIGQTVIPPFAGVFSALGLLAAGVRHDLVRTHAYLTDRMPPSAGPGIFQDLAEEMIELLKREGRDLSKISVFRSADLRYLGQVFELSLPVEGDLRDPEEIKALERRFEEKYRAAFHYILPGSRIEIVNFRLTATLKSRVPGSEVFFHTEPDTETKGTPSSRRVFDDRRRQFIDVPAYLRERLRGGDEIAGPALIDAEDTTINIMEGQIGYVDERGCLVIRSR
jgi:N-methylhydantoinase A